MFFEKTRYLGLMDRSRLFARLKGRRRFVFSALALLVAITFSLSAYFAYKTYHTDFSRTDAMATLVKKLGTVADLPADEAPTVAEVTDKDRFDDQPFYRKAENGDMIFLYAQAGRAVLYRPSNGRIIAMTTVDTGKSASSGQSIDSTMPDSSPGADEPVAATHFSVALYDGATASGNVDRVRREIVEKFPSLSINTVQHAARGDYEETLVIDLTTNNADLASGVAETIGGIVSEFAPSGETNPSSDFLIIVGKADGSISR